MKEKNDFLVDFFKNRRDQFIRGTIWFSITFILILLLISLPKGKDDFIAKIHVNDIIINKKKLLNELDNLAQQETLKGMVVSVNSPGGTVVSSQRIYSKLKEFKKKIPVAVSMQEVAASGGYMVSLAGDKIFCHRGTITGSIGVILQSASFRNLFEKIGIDPIIIKSGKMKSSPNPLEEIDDEIKLNITELVNNMYKDFLSLVINSRKLKKSSIESISDGSVFTGQQALELNLVDSIGDENDAIEWIRKKAGLDSDVKVVDIDPEEDFLNFFDFPRKTLKNFNGLFALWIPTYE